MRPAADTTHGVIVPSYNSGCLLAETLEGVLASGLPVVTVIDGSNDGSAESAQKLQNETDGLDVLILPRRGGKGAAVLAGLEAAEQRGWTHAAVLDADGQHDAADLPRFVETSRAHPDAMILGVPVFGPDAPMLRVLGRRLGNFFANVETRWGSIGDSLFGFRIYPVQPALRILRGMRAGRGFDFDTRMAVQLFWAGIRPVNLPTRVRYLPRGRGISHFRYLRDNLLLVRTHAELLLRSLINKLRRLKLVSPRTRLDSDVRSVHYSAQACKPEKLSRG